MGETLPFSFVLQMQGDTGCLAKVVKHQFGILKWIKMKNRHLSCQNEKSYTAETPLIKINYLIFNRRCTAPPRLLAPYGPPPLMCDRYDVLRAGTWFFRPAQAHPHPWQRSVRRGRCQKRLRDLAQPCTTNQPACGTPAGRASVGPVSRIRSMYEKHDCTAVHLSSGVF